MAQRRDTFAKRQREADLKQRALAKQARRIAKRDEARASKDRAAPGDAEAHAVVGGAPTTGVAPAVDRGGTQSAVPLDPVE